MQCHFEYLSGKKGNTNWKIYMYHYVHYSIISNSQDMEETEVPITGEWIRCAI